MSVLRGQSLDLESSEVLGALVDTTERCEGRRIHAARSVWQLRLGSQLKSFRAQEELDWASLLS